MNKTQEFWMGHLEALKSEAITATAYAKQHGLGVKTLLKWRRKCSATAAANSVTVKETDFVALRVATPAAEQKRPGCVVCLPCGLRIDMPTLPTPQWIAELGRLTQGTH